MTLSQTAQAEGLSLLVQFGSTARGEENPRDLDLGLLGQAGWDAPRPPGLWDRWRLELERGDLDLVWLPEANWLLCQRVAREGRPLYEDRPGRFRAFLLAAHFRSVDAEVWRRRQKAYLERRVKGGADMDLDLVRAKATQLGEYLPYLEEFAAMPEERFAVREHFGAERILELLVECAGAINSELAQGLAGIPPSDYYSSFFSLARTGTITQEQALELSRYARLRNALVHHYEDVRLAELYRAVQAGVPLWKAYLASVLTRL